MPAPSNTPKEPGPGLFSSPFAWLALGLVVVFGVVLVRLLDSHLGLDFWSRDADVELARQSIESKDWTAALDAIQKVPSDSRQKVAYLRVLADYLKGTRSSPQILSRVIASLEAEGALEPADFVWICGEHLLAGRVSEAQEAWDRLPEQLRQTLQARELELVLLGQQGKQEALQKAEQEMFDLFPDEPSVAVRKAVKDLDGTLPEIHAAAWARLWELAALDDVHGLQAIRLLANRRELSLPEARRLLEIFGRHPSQSIHDRLLVLTSLYRLSSEGERKQILDREMSKNKLQERGSALAFAAWLAKMGAIDRMRSFCSTNAVLNTGETFMLLAQGLAEEQNWKALWELLSRSSQVPVPASRVATWRTLAFRNLHEDDVRGIREHLAEAISLANQEKNAVAMMGAASMAEQWGHPDLALRAYLLLSESDPAREIEVLERAWGIAGSLKDTVALLAISERQMRLKPDIPKYALHWRYITLLSRKEVLSPGTAKDALEGSAEGLMVRALEAHRAQKPEEVVAALDQIRQPGSLPPGQRAVYAGLLSQNPDRVGEAHAIAEKIPAQLLLPEEAAFLKMAL